MRIVIIIPAYNEAALISKTLDSLLTQTFSAEKIMVVDDGSTDETPQVVASYSTNHSNIQLVQKNSEAAHLPGSKVVQAFNYGLKHLDIDYDLLCKFDAENHNLSGMLATNLSASIAFKTLKGASKCSKISKAVTASAVVFFTASVSKSRSSPLVFFTV